MRILLVPKLEEVHRFNSLTVCPMMLVKAFLTLHPDCRFTIAVHESFVQDRSWLSRYWLTPADQERVTLLPVRADLVGEMSRPKKLGHVIGNALFGQIGPLSQAARYVDAIIADGVFPSHAAIRVAAQGTYSRGMQRTIPLIAWGEFCPSPSWGNWVFNEWDGQAYATGAFYADFVVWQSRWIEADFAKAYKQMFNSAYVDRLRQKSMVIPSGIMCDRLATKKPRVPGQKPVAIWSGYYEEDWWAACAMLDAFKTGAFSKVIVHLMPQFTPVPEEELKALRGTPGVEVHEHMEQPKYFELLASADVFVTGVKEVTYGLRYAEMLATGLLGVVGPDLKLNLLPDDYPLVLGKLNAVQMVIAASHVWERMPEMVEKLTKEIRAKHDYLRCFDQFYRIVERCVADEQGRTAFGGFVELAKLALQGVQSIGHEEAVEKIRPLTISKADLRSNALQPPGFLRWAILQAGFTDDGSTEEPKYSRIR